MKKILSLSILLTFFACASFTYAQMSEPNNAYKEGESLIYEAKLKKFGFAFSVAELTFDVSKLPATENYFIKAEARSKGTLTGLITSLANFKFYQRYESTIDGNSFDILKTVKHDEQGDRIREGQADFNYDTKKVFYTETDPKDAARPPRRVASTIELDTQDVISSIYAMRGQELAVGKSFVFKVSDSGLVYEIPVRVTARERKKSILGKKWCWRVEPEVFGDRRIIEQKGDLVIWITDDEDKIPIRAELDTKIGEVRIKLEKIQTKNLNVQNDGKDDDDDDDDDGNQ